MKKLLYLTILQLALVSCSEPQTSRRSEESESAALSLGLETEKNAVKSLMQSYKEILESLDVTDSYSLFSEDSQVLEQGKIEGTYADYIANHIGPELSHFESFTFTNYEISVIVDIPYAFTTESYVYQIVLKEDGTRLERKAAATSVLKKIDGVWKIIKTHSSSRANN